MAYLYAGLGIAMMVGIMAVFEMASGFDQQQLAAQSGSSAKAANYFASSDRSAFLKMDSLPQAPPPTCMDVASGLGLDMDTYAAADSTGFFRCIIQAVKDDKYVHRVLIDSQNNYWSCFFERTDYAPDQCSFE